MNKLQLLFTETISQYLDKANDPNFSKSLFQKDSKMKNFHAVPKSQVSTDEKHINFHWPSVYTLTLCAIVEYINFQFVVLALVSCPEFEADQCWVDNLM